MAKNTLFNFIKLQLSGKNIPTSHWVLDTNKEGHPYYRLELTKNHNFKIKDQAQEYTLQDHHISIYKSEQRNNPNLSQYHYTAYFRDKQGLIYRLHVFFNAFDQLTQNPVFELETKDGFKAIEAKHLEESFIRLALDTTGSVIADLRKQYSDTVQALETRYSELDIELGNLFEITKEHYSAYQKKLEETYGILEQLIPLVRHTFYKNAFKFLRETRKSLPESTGARIVVGTPKENSKKEQEVDSEVEMNSSSKIQAISVPPGVGTNLNASNGSHQKHEEIASDSSTNVSEFERELATLQSSFKTLKTEDDIAQGKKLEQILASTYQLSMVSDQLGATPSGLKQLQNLRQEILQLGTRLLPTLLLKNQFSIAKDLISFHHLLTAKYLNMAIHTRNQELLEFVLKYGDFDLNNQPVSIGNKKYPSAVCACLALNSAQSPMTNCLSTLIKHGASPLVKDEKGLPVAFTIMATDNHPLRGALLANQDKTINSVIFFKQLRVILLQFLATQNSDASLSQLIDSELDYYSTRIEALLKSKSYDVSDRFLQKSLDYFAEKHLGAMTDKLRRDPEIIAIQKKLQSANSELMLLVKKGKIRVANSLMKEQITDLDKLLVKWNIKIDDFNFVKKHILEFLNQALISVEKKIELVTLQIQITAHPIIGKPSKGQRALLARQDVLLREIKELDNEIGIFQDFKSLDRSLDILSELEKGINMLKELDMGLTGFQNVQNTVGLSSLMNQFSLLFSNLPKPKDILQDLNDLSKLEGHGESEEKDDKEIQGSKDTFVKTI